MDRTDPSQYQTENSGVIYNGSLTGTDEQVASEPVVFAHGEQMLDYVDPTVIPPTIPDGLFTQTKPYTNKVAVYRPIPTGISGVIASGKAEFLGYEFHNLSASANAQVNIHDGFDSTGTAVFHITLAAGESVRDFLPFPIRFTTGCYINAVSGSVEGNVFMLRNENV